jgi:hypothetical protein
MAAAYLESDDRGLSTLAWKLYKLHDEIASS